MKWPPTKRPLRNEFTRLLSKPSSSEEFLGAHGAQDSRVLGVREDPSTGATQKLPGKDDGFERSLLNH
ncbi:MAG: hypothetical protein LBG20_02450 [Holosporaceae bacterium]|jgi:hypothetical protein|nr:hypothetical protein [Holosporaceae bacterium]